jgi:F-type H+-transporting ATPase subunit b
VLLVAAPAYASEGGLVLTPDLLLLGVLLALFAAMIFPLNALIFRPILRVFDERRQKISGTAARAEKLRKEADEIIGRYEHAVQTVREEAEAQRRAQLEVARGEGASELSGARAGADREIETARQSIESSLDAARAALRGEAAILARQAAERVLGRPL